MHTPERLLVAVSVSALLFWPGLVAVDASRANALIREAATEMRTWEFSGSRPDPATARSVQERLVAAAQLHPLDPAHQELLGLLGSMQTDTPETVSQSVGYLVKALELRPVSPHTWARLAEARYRLGESGRSLELALERASQLGPAEPGVQQLVADYGLAVWGEITPAGQASVDRMVAAGIRRNPLEMLQISERRGRLDVACRHLAGSSRTAGPRRGSLCPWEITP